MNTSPFSIRVSSPAVLKTLYALAYNHRYQGPVVWHNITNGVWGLRFEPSVKYIHSYNMEMPKPLPDELSLDDVILRLKEPPCPEE